MCSNYLWLHTVLALSQGAEGGDHCYYFCYNDTLEKETICHCIGCDIFLCHKMKTSMYMLQYIYMVDTFSLVSFVISSPPEHFKKHLSELLSVQDRIHCHIDILHLV